MHDEVTAVTLKNVITSVMSQTRRFCLAYTQRQLDVWKWNQRGGQKDKRVVGSAGVTVQERKQQHTGHTQYVGTNRQIQLTYARTVQLLQYWSSIQIDEDHEGEDAVWFLSCDLESKEILKLTHYFLQRFSYFQAGRSVITSRCSQCLW